MSVCPRDSSPLEPRRDVFGAGTFASVCPKCAGVMVDWNQGQQFFESLGLAVKALHELVAASQSKPRQTETVACTQCNAGTMKSMIFRGAEIDLCESCGASWFDAGELHRITKGKLGELKVSGKRQANESSEVVGVFEMLWNCAFCDTKGLLAASNRFCPNCGAQQDASKRYFPPPGTEVEANVEFDGVDVSCPACQTPNGAKAHNCKHCGSPLDGSAAVNKVADRNEKQAPIQPVAAPTKGSRWWLWAIGIALLLCCLLSGVVMFWTKEESMSVTGHSWVREIAVEAVRAVPGSEWCDSVPSGAYRVSRHREERRTRQVPDGESCSMRDVDRGNGTFARVRECVPKYRDEPVYDDKCEFVIDRWTTIRSDKSGGDSMIPAPTWPRSSASGQERAGKKSEVYILFLKDTAGKEHTCELSQERWQSVDDGSLRKLEVGVISGSVDCKKL
jgi:Zn-finger nucleic acid-binding protein